MSIKAKLGDIEFTLETDEDLRRFLAIAKNGSAGPITPTQPQGVIEKLRAAYSRIQKSNNPNQAKAIRALAENPEGLTDVEIRDLLDLENNNKIGGLMAGIQKNATACGLQLEQIVWKRKLIGAKPAKFSYRLTPDMRDIVLNNRPRQVQA